MTYDTNQDKPRSMMVYYCGGAGVNIGRLMRQVNDVAYTENTDFVMVDTSEANVRDGVPVIRIGSKDGSGGIRKTNVEDIIREVPAILNQYRPSTFNVVVFSAAGGSGSAIGPSIVSELIQRGKAVVPIVIGASRSQVDLVNTIGTIKSLESIALKREHPVVMRYVENNPDFSRDANDKRVLSALAHLSVLFSNNNWELDTEDVYNWLNYTKLVNQPPRLMTLNIVTKDDAMPSGRVYTVATLTDTDLDHELTGEYVHQYVGKINRDKVVVNGDILPVHYIVSDGIADTYARLNKRYKDLKATEQTIANRETILGDDDVASNGLVL